MLAGNRTPYKCVYSLSTLHFHKAAYPVCRIFKQNKEKVGHFYWKKKKKFKGVDWRKYFCKCTSFWATEEFTLKIDHIPNSPPSPGCSTSPSKIRQVQTQTNMEKTMNHPATWTSFLCLDNTGHLYESVSSRRVVFCMPRGARSRDRVRVRVRNNRLSA